MSMAILLARVWSTPKSLKLWADILVNLPVEMKTYRNRSLVLGNRIRFFVCRGSTASLKVDIDMIYLMCHISYINLSMYA